MLTLLNYLYGMMTVLAVCLEPPNWKYCSKDIHIWLLPEIRRGIEMWLDKDHNHLYQEEREALDKYY